MFLLFPGKRTLRVLRCDDWIKTLSYKIKGKNLTGKLFSFVANIFRKRIVKKIKAELDGKVGITFKYLYFKVIYL